MSFRWRKFDFFDQEELVEPVRDAAGAAGSSSEPLPPGTAETLRSVSITCTCATAGSAGAAEGAGIDEDGLLALGDASGDVHLVPRSLRLHSFRAHADEVSHVQLLRGGLWLATLGLERDGSPTRATFKLWRLARAANSTELSATCVRIAKAFASADVEEGVTAMAVSECLTMAALGLRSGAVLLARTAAHDLSRERALAFGLCAPAPAPGGGVNGIGAGGAGGCAPAGGVAGGAHGSASGSAAANAVNALFFSSLCAVSDELEAAPPSAPAPSSTTPHRPPTGLFVLSQSAVYSVNLSALPPSLPPLHSHLAPAPAQPQARAAQATGAAGSGGALHAHALCTLDSSAGCARGCSALAPSGALAVARGEAIFLFGLEERGPCFAFDGPKRAVAFVGGYLAVLSEGAHDGAALSGSSAALSLYDLRHKLVAHAQPAPARSVRVLAGAWGGCALLGSEGRAWRLRERPTAAKLLSLTARGQFELAVDLAVAHGCSAEEVGSLRWQHANYLLTSLGEPEMAAAQLVMTIGAVPAAKVVSLLLNAARIEQLATYLEALHAHAAAAAANATAAAANAAAPADGGGSGSAAARAAGGAGAGNGEGGRCVLRAEHTSLLLACYLQLGRKDKAAALVSSDGYRVPASTASAAAGSEASRAAAQPGAAAAGAGGESGGERGAPPSGAASGAGAPSAPPPAQSGADGEGFDAAAAVRLCTEGGLVDEALQVAARHGRHAEYVSLLLHAVSPPRPALALNYIAALPRPDARAALRAHGQALLDAMPERTTGLLMHALGAAAGEAAQDWAAELKGVLRMYAQQPHWLMVLLEYLAALPIPALAPAAAAGAHGGSGGRGGGGAAGGGGDVSAGGAQLLWEALLELYLLVPSGSADAQAAQLVPGEGDGGGGAADSTAVGARLRRLEEERARGEENALALLCGSDAPFSAERALVLCAQRGFDRGVRAVLERGRCYALIVQRLLDRGEHAEALLACRRYADAEPALWVTALQHWGRAYGAGGGHADGADGGHADELLLPLIEEALREVERLSLLPPVLALHDLSQNARLPLGPFRAFLLRHLAAARASRAEDERQASSLAAETAAMRAELRELRTSARVFQLSRCCRSGAPLALPTVHFLCGHSFNRSALGESSGGQSDECPLCAPEHARVLGRQRTLEARASQHDAFFKQLEGSADGFATVAEFYGRGAMGTRVQR